MTDTEPTTESPPLTAIEAWMQARLGRRLSVRLSDSEAGWFFMYVCGALQETVLEEQDGADFTLELKIEGGQAVVLYADLIAAIAVQNNRIEIDYRGGNLEIEAEFL